MNTFNPLIKAGALESLLSLCLELFIELALKPVLREEAEHQAAERKRLDKRSTAKGREGEPLCTDVEALLPHLPF